MGSGLEFWGKGVSFLFLFSCFNSCVVFLNDFDEGMYHLYVWGQAM